MTTKTLVLSFLDEDSNEANITIKNPKENLDRTTVIGVMNTIITNAAILSNQGNALECVNDCYYKTVTTTALTSSEGE